MKAKIFALFVAILVAVSLNAENGQIYKVKKLTGRVEVRHGLSETWTKLLPSDTLKPEDTIHSFADSYIEIEGERFVFKLYGEAIVNISDLRRLTKEELLLALAFEEIKSVPEKSTKKFPTAKSTAVYGTDISRKESKLNLIHENPTPWANGVKVLFNNGFYETSAIRAKNIASRFDELKNNYEIISIPAQSLEKIGLYEEAISEYSKIYEVINDPALKNEIGKRIQKLKTLLRK